MKVLNIHSRIINRPVDEVGQLLTTLASNDDRIWPYERWPAMKFKDGFKIGSKGGHGPIRYTISEYILSSSIVFTFSKPKDFHGTHSYKFKPLSEDKTKVCHTINMNTVGFGTLKWIIAIRWLHDALLEDSLDKIENQFHENVKNYETNWYVKLLRWIAKRRK